MVELRDSESLDVGGQRVDGFLPIEDYAAIGDGRALALVGSDGSIDWMCLPTLDGSSVFAALLDPVRGGSFELAPAVPFEVRRFYVPRTNVLCSEYDTSEGRVRVTEALTIDPSQTAPWRELVRQVEGLSGTVPMRWRLAPRFEYGRASATPVTRGGRIVWRHRGLQLALQGWGTGEPSVGEGVVQGGFDVLAGQQAMLALVASDGVALPSAGRSEIERRLESTARLWRDWVGRASYDGPWRGAVERSLLAIRLLADRRTGAIAAAGTTSLPEVLGGKRNYDYRFGWVRDLSFTVNALLRTGMEELAHVSIGWLFDAIEKTHPRVDPVYALNGNVVRSQRTLPLAGYRNTAPVHEGNQAGSQLQLGGFGDLLETIWGYTQCGHLLAPEVGERIADTADLLCAIWRNSDSGLWELGQRADYATSKIGCWTALERVLDLAADGQVPARHVQRWRSERDRMRAFIDTQLWSDERQTYLMKAGSEALDCGVLLATRRGYVDPAGPRMTGTVAALSRELRADGPLFYRYSGMQNEENAFLACSFWMVEALALGGRADEAGELMDLTVALGNGFGLFSEEMEPGTRAMRGNFPQALTHLALISAADILAGCTNA